ncbi:MAG: Fic family protein [Planctomycetes bacterium]|nr:Fic family protein [Planctomycetota bacterium]
MNSKQLADGPPTGPWYKHFDYWNTEALRYLAAFRNIPGDAPAHAEFRAFEQLSDWRMVFESNLLEGAGLSEGETRKVLAPHTRMVPSSYDDFRKMSCHGIFGLREMAEQDERLLAGALQQHDKDIKPNYKFSGKSRGLREVEQHFFALIDARARAFEFKQALSRRTLFLSLSRRYTDTSELAREWEKLTGQAALAEPDAPQLLSQKWLKELHATVAEGLLPDDAEVGAGEYRTDIRTVGHDVAFPSPALVPKCIEQYVKTSNDQIDALFNEAANPFDVSARISYDLVRIHPFPDFNGRISRLVLVTVLMVCDVPFAVTLRGNKKERQRYLRALKSANRGDLRPYATLIAMCVAQAFTEVDENLQRAGYGSILEFLK